MARTSSPDSATDQFYFNLTDNSATLPSYTVFGTTTSSSTLSTLSQIPTFNETNSGVPTNISGNFATLPLSNFTHGNNDPNFPGDATASNFAEITSVTISQKDALTYSIVTNSNQALVTASFVPNHPEQLQLTYAANQTGTATIVVKATNKAGQSVTQTFTVTVS